MGADEEPPSAEALHLGVGYGFESELLEPLHLDAVVDDVPERKDGASLPECLLGAGDGSDDSEAESRPVIDGDFHALSDCRTVSAVRHGGYLSEQAASR